MWELSKTFLFEAAHTLSRTIDREASLRIHGHSYRAQVTLRGRPDPETGMLVDLGRFEAALKLARDGLDHRLLDEVEGLGPATLENLAAWIWRTAGESVTAVHRVTVYRDSTGDMCAYFGPDAA
jgi:6-pyruvoyltetrahydropterin/6-carboxytetrahydropterin synthase